MNEGEWGKGEKGRGRRIVFHTRLCLSGKTLPAEDLEDDNGKVLLHAHSDSTGTPSLPVAAGDPGSSWSSSRFPPVRGGGRALQCRCESGRGRKLRWLRFPSQLAVAAAADHGPAKAPPSPLQFPAPERPQVPTGPSLAGEERPTG